VFALHVFAGFAEEDAFGVYSRVLLSYFMAEGIVNGHSVFVASQDRDLDTMVNIRPLASSAFIYSLDVFYDLFISDF